MRRQSATKPLNAICSACDVDLHEFCFGHCRCRDAGCVVHEPATAIGLPDRHPEHDTMTAVRWNRGGRRKQVRSASACPKTPSAPTEQLSPSV